MKQIIGYETYGYEDGKVYNIKQGKEIKLQKNGAYALHRKGRISMMPANKIAFCATYGINPDRIPPHTHFTIEGGEFKVGDWTEREKKRFKTMDTWRKASIERIDETIQWLNLQKDFLLGKDNRKEIYIHLTKAAEEARPYLHRTICRKAETIDNALLEAIDKAFETATGDKLFILSPSRWLGFAVRHKIFHTPREVEFNDAVKYKRAE